MHDIPPTQVYRSAYWIELSPTSMDPARDAALKKPDPHRWRIELSDLDHLTEILDSETDYQIGVIFSGSAKRIIDEIVIFRKAFPFVPLIAISDAITEEDQLEILDKGADYCIDSANPNSGLEIIYAHLQRALKFRRNSEAREAAETALHNAASEVATTAAETFVRMITDHLANTLQTEIALVGRIGEFSQKSLKQIKDRTLALKTTAISIRGFSSMNTEMPLENSPFKSIYETGEALLIEDNLAEKYPSDLYIEQSGSKSFFGIPLRDSRKQVVGIMAVMDIKPMRNRRLIESTIQIFASRIANEIERSQVNEELKAQASILQQINEGVFTSNLDGTITSWNQQAEKLFGYSSGELVGASLRNIMANASHAEMRQNIIAPVLVSSVHQTEITLRHRNGNEIYCLSNISLERNGRGNIVGIIFCCTDITEKKLAEARERSAQQRLAFHINRAPLAFIEWGTDFEITAWNPAAESLFGYKGHEVLGRGFDMLNVEESEATLGAAEAQRQDLLRTRNKRIIESRTKSGRKLTCEWVNTPLIDENDTIVGYASLVQDITARVESERSMRRAKEAAEAANNLKNDFLAVMSHEIRTPLNSIIGFADLLHSVEEDDYKLENLETIRSNGRELLEMIESVLTYSRIESGDMQTQYSDMDLVALVFEFAESYSQKAAEKGLELEFAADETLPETVHQCWDHLKIILEKVLDNAVKFTSDGTIQVSVKGEPKITSSDWRFTVSVQDTGNGVSTEEKERLFQVFSQADGTATRNYEGIGLGLAISRRLCDLIGATISVESEQGKGSVFMIHFDAPLTESKPPITPLAHLRDLGERYPLRVLIAEDEENNQVLFSRLLRKLGYDAEIAGDGARALELVHEQAFDLVFMDINMPAMDGLQTSEAIRNSKHPGVADTFICAVTADIHRTDPQACRAVGMNDHISKPIFVGKLKDVLIRASQHKQRLAAV